MFTTAIFSLLTFISITWSIPLILGKLFGFNLFKISTQQYSVLVLKSLPLRGSIINDDKKPEGWIWGCHYIGYIYEADHDTIIYLYTTKKYYDDLMKPITNNDQFMNLNENVITIYQRFGTYFHLRYFSRKFNTEKYPPRKNQQNVINEIIEFYQKNQTVVAYIYGKPGVGKSIIPLLIAKQLKGSFCLDHRPTDPGDNLSTLYNSICPTKDSPLILVIEEIDILIMNVHEKKIEQHKDIPTNIFDKSSYNIYFDWIDRKLYPHLIIVLTSNKTPEFIDELDPSYLRKGRINLKIEITDD